MANNVNIPAQGTGDTTPKVSTDQVSADSSQVQNVQLTAVAGGVLTRNPTIPVSNASLPLPAGASTETTLAAANTAIGTTADAASSTTGTVIAHLRKIRDVLVAGLPALVSGRVPVDGSGVTQPVSGTVSTTPPANASTNLAQVAGATTATGNGTAAGALRVALPTDGTGVVGLSTGANVIGSLAANQSVNVAQVAGATVAQGHGTAATALRVELPTDGTGTVVLAAGAATIGALTANQSTNVAQINGVTPLMGAGISGTGATRVTPSIAAAGAAPTAFTATSSTQVFASNASRRLFTVYNNSDKDLYLMLASAAVSTTSFHVKVASGGNFFSTTDYSGEIRGIMSAAITIGQVNPGEFT